MASIRIMQQARNITRLSIEPPEKLFKGALFSAFNKSGKKPANHEMDTDLDQYHRTLRDIVIPDCMEVALDAKGYPERVKELISYTNPAFGDHWNFAVELAYRMVAPPEHQTEQNLTKARILRAIMDLIFTMTAVIDDVTDNSTERRNKKSWHKICTGGVPAAIYDGSVIGYLPFHILKKRFKSDPGYTLLMEKVAEASTMTLVGQTLDVLAHGNAPTLEAHRAIVTYKAGLLVSLQPALGMLHSGILDENVLHQVMHIFHRFGNLIQIGDDFGDYFCPPEETGKPACDFHNGGTTWVSATAVGLFNPQQAKTFKECYGSNEPGKVEEVMKLYDEIDIPGQYIKFMRSQYESISALIRFLPDEKLKRLCHSYMNWLIIDVCDH